MEQETRKASPLRRIPQPNLAERLGELSVGFKHILQSSGFGDDLIEVATVCDGLSKAIQAGAARKGQGNDPLVRKGTAHLDELTALCRQLHRTVTQTERAHEILGVADALAK